jgi:molybdenum cofactor biosynthesis protein B
MAGIDESREFKPLNLAILTVSDTRSLENDTSGDTLQQRAESAGHRVVARTLLRDSKASVSNQVMTWATADNIDVILTTGGTGLTYRDITPEAIRDIMDKEIEGFGELFRWISYKIIATSTVQSRAMGALVKGTYVFVLPGSPSACSDAWDHILLFQLDSRHRPCNFAELIPRLK